MYPIYFYKIFITSPCNFILSRNHFSQIIPSGISLLGLKDQSTWTSINDRRMKTVSRWLLRQITIKWTLGNFWWYHLYFYSHRHLKKRPHSDNREFLAANWFPLAVFPFPVPAYNCIARFPGLSSGIFLQFIFGNSLAPVRHFKRGFYSFWRPFVQLSYSTRLLSRYAFLSRLIWSRSTRKMLLILLDRTNIT